MLDLLQRIAKRTILLGGIALAGVSLNYERIQNTISVATKDGEIVYVHSDPTTTHILNYLAGKEPISKEERLDILVDGLRTGCEELNWDCPDFSLMNEEQFTTWLIEKSGPRIQEQKENIKSLDDFLNAGYTPLPLQRPYDATLYQALWQMEQDCGAPKIEWSLGKRRPGSDEGLEAGYKFYTNTVNIIPFNSPARKVVAELAHAKQHMHNPIDFYVEGIKDVTRVTYGMIKGASLSDAFEEQYFTPGSIEFVAHGIIEPSLYRKYGLNRKTLEDKD